MTKLSILIVAHNEERHLEDCLSCLDFADEIVMVLDKCTDGSKTIAQKFTKNITEGSWDIEAERRQIGIDACNGEWIVEVDADERITPELAKEILETIKDPKADYYYIPVLNHIGRTPVLYGWGAYFGKASYPGLFKKQNKKWVSGRYHANYEMSGKDGGKLESMLTHYVDDSISDMLHRLDRYSTIHAVELREREKMGSFAANFRRIFTRFFKCYVQRKGYREGLYGFMIALCAGLYPLLSYIKAKTEDGSESC